MIIVDVLVDKKSRLMDNLDKCLIPKITEENWDGTKLFLLVITDKTVYSYRLSICNLQSEPRVKLASAVLPMIKSMSKSLFNIGVR